MPAFFCGLIDDVLQTLLSRSCPSYFLPQVNLLDQTDDSTILNLGEIINFILLNNNLLAQIILMVRSDPVEQIRNALEQVSAARGLTQVHNEQSYGKKRVISGIDSSGQALYKHVRATNDTRTEQSQESLAERNCFRFIRKSFTERDVYKLLLGCEPYPVNKGIWCLYKTWKCKKHKNTRSGCPY